MVMNLDIYNRLRAVPQEAIKPIAAGRLKGFSDINPMWRIKALTEIFGPCGLGWWYKITDKRMEAGSDGETRAFVDIELYYRWNDQVSMPIPGTGGASFITREKNGAYTSDECFKMALTDALSVAAKALGLAANIYFEKDRDKYTTAEEPNPAQKVLTLEPKPAPVMNGGQEVFRCDDCGMPIDPVQLKDGKVLTPKEIASRSIAEFDGRQLCLACARARKQ